MAENRIKIGAMVDESVYNNFVRFVEEKRGQKRGVLGTELENALKEYMDEDIATSSDVSNEDILDELRELRAAYENNPPRTHTQNETAASDGSDNASAASGDGAPRTHTGDVDDENDLTGEESDGSDDSREVIGGVPVPDERPHYRASPVPERVAWIVSKSHLAGKVPFQNVRKVVAAYHDYTDKKERDLAWRVAQVLAPSRSDLPDDIPEPELDSKLMARGEFDVPRRSDGGAWYRVDKYSRSSMKRQLPTEQGDVYVYLGEKGAADYCEDIGIDVSDSNSDSDSDSDETDGGVSTDDFDEVDIEGATNSIGESSGGVEEEADEVFGEPEDADRGR